MRDRGLGVVVLPCSVGDTMADLQRVVSDPIIEVMMDLWVLSHPDVRKAARVRALATFLADTVLADRYLFEGRRPLPRASVTETS